MTIAGTRSGAGIYDITSGHFHFGVVGGECQVLDANNQLKSVRYLAFADLFFTGSQGQLIDSSNR